MYTQYHEISLNDKIKGLCFNFTALPISDTLYGKPQQQFKSQAFMLSGIHLFLDWSGLTEFKTSKWQHNCVNYGRALSSLKWSNLITFNLDRW